ncbi:MAG: hypothetical protein IJ681_05415 [Bacteroidales bacterium]|nr:hypothetical protein [Bacteroidales bacterium]
MNQNSEQIRGDYSIDTAQDEPIRNLNKVISEILGRNCKIEKIYDKKIPVFIDGNNKIVLLVKAVTYLGNPHSIHKKRMQLPTWFKEFASKVAKEKPEYDVKFIGVYHYNGLFIFVDFKKDTYINKKMHNSSAHVYINDLYQALISVSGTFTKQDAQGNTLTTIRANQFKNYLLGKTSQKSELFELFTQFNTSFPFNSWITAQQAIPEMFNNNWDKWKETEWAGWYLEYLFNKFTEDNNTAPIMMYVGGKKDLNFDVWFDKNKFYGDLKSSSKNDKNGKQISDAPANDQTNVINCINQYGKLWFIIYEHDTVHDVNCTDYPATRFRTKFIKSKDPKFTKDELSYKDRMKNKVCYDRMSIIEVNRINFSKILTTFNQGHQQDMSKRNPKFKITKSILKDDNFVIFRYSPAK